MTRKGMGKGRGMGYKNIVTRDPYIHGLSAKGVKTYAKLTKKQKKAISRGIGTAIGLVAGAQATRGTGYEGIGAIAGGYAGYKIGESLSAKGRQILDMDDVYLLGDFAGKLKKGEFGLLPFPDFETVEKWKVDDSIYIIGRNYKQGESILLDVVNLNAKGKSLYAKMTAQELEKNLSMFTGTEQYHKLSFMPLLATDGVAYLMENAESYWLFDAIASYQGKMAKEPFQVWILEVKDNKAVLKGYRDYSEKNPKKYKPLVTQKIGYTDFPLKKIKIWVENGVALLPSEH